MNIEKTQQGFLCTEIIKNHRLAVTYIFYSKREAKKLFKEYLKTFKN